MKKILFRLIAFLLPLLTLLYAIPVSKRRLYAGLKETCDNRALWIYDRIWLNNTPADIVFLGTSHTMNGIDDRLMNEENQEGMTLVNMGQCSFGLNLSYAYLQELIKNKKPRQIVLEVRNEEDRYTHPVFAYIADNKEVLTEPLLFNRDYISDNYRHIYYKLEIIRDGIFGEQQETDINADTYGCRAIDDTVAISTLEQAKQNYKQRKPLSAFATWFYMSYPRAYYSKIAALCKANNIKLIFLYLPTYAEPYRKPDEYAFYKQYGAILMPPDSIFQNTSYWFDENHLNLAGANALSEWVQQQLR